MCTNQCTNSDNGVHFNREGVGVHMILSYYLIRYKHRQCIGADRILSDYLSCCKRREGVCIGRVLCLITRVIGSVVNV